MLKKFIENLQSHQISCFYATVKRCLRQNKLFGRHPVKKPFVSAKNCRAQLKFAKEHLNWTANKWSKILRSDESKFDMFGSDGIKYVRCPIGLRNDIKYQVPTVKHGGCSVMVWSCFSRDGVGPIYRVQGIMDQNMCKGIIKDIMPPHAKDKMLHGWTFQHDNDPKHTSKLVTEFLAQKKVRILEWPSQPPDLNPIKHLWEHIERKISFRKPSNQHDLFKLIKRTWGEIPIDVLINLVDSMPR